MVDQEKMAKWLKGSRWQRLRWVVAERDGYRCQLQVSSQCRIFPGDRFEIDHIVPRAEMVDEGQFWELKNLRFVCGVCHRFVTARQNRVRVRREGDRTPVEELKALDDFFNG